MKRILMSLLTIGLVASVAFGATRAQYSDDETSEGNTFSAGTLDLKVDGEDDPNVVHLSYTNLKPGETYGYYKWCLRNDGSVDGQPSVEFSVIANNENGTNEPEDTAEAEPYASATEGELGQYLKPTIGYAPCGWSVPSILYSNWQAGPVHPWGTPGLNELSGMTVGAGNKFTFPVLGPGEEIGFFFKVALTGHSAPNDLERWDGTKWLESMIILYRVMLLCLTLFSIWCRRHKDLGEVELRIWGWTAPTPTNSRRVNYG